MRRLILRGRWGGSRVSGVLAAFIVSIVANTGEAATEIGVADVIVGSVYGRSVNKRMTAGEKLFFNQKVRTGTSSAATLEFTDKTRMTMGERAEMLLDDLVYDPRKAELNGVVELTRGVLRFVSQQAATVNVKVRTPSATIGIRGTAFDVLTDPRKMEVSVIVGSIQVSSQFGTQTVGPGQTFSVESGTGAAFNTERSAEMAQAIAKMLSMVSVEQTGLAAKTQSNPFSTRQTQSSPRPSQQSVASVTTSRQPEAFYHAIRGKNLENLIYVDVKYGRIVIELLPGLAPRHVSRIKRLTRDGFYDGLTFHRVQKGFVAETGDPTGTGTGGSGQELKAELSDESFVRGVVGMKHLVDQPDTGDSQFFIITGPANHLDGKYTVWGRVIYGMDFVDLLQQGAPPKNPDSIQKMRIAIDVKES